MASLWTNKGVFLVMSGQLDLDSAAGLKHVMFKNTLTPNQDDNFMSGVSSHECNATNYTGGFNGSGRKALASKTVTEDDTNNKGVFDAADPSVYASLGGGTDNTLRYSGVVLEVTSDADSPVICYNDYGADKTTNGGDFTVQWAATGIATINT